MHPIYLLSLRSSKNIKMKKTFNIDTFNALCKNTMLEHLGILFTEVSEGRVVATMPVDKRTHQIMKRLHGGASMALAESVGGAGSLTLVDGLKYAVLGVDINGSHVGTTTESYVIAEANIIHQGKSTHVWEIRITDKNNTLISICRLTNRIIPIKD